VRQGEEELPPEDETEDDLTELAVQAGDEDGVLDNGCAIELLLEVLAEMEDEELENVLASNAQIVDASQPVFGEDDAGFEETGHSMSLVDGQLLQAEQGGNGEEVALEAEVPTTLEPVAHVTQDGGDMDGQGDGSADLGVCASQAADDVVVVPDTQCLWNAEEQQDAVWEVPDTQAEQVVPSQSVGVDEEVGVVVDGKVEVGGNGEALERVVHDEVCGDAVCTPTLQRGGCKLLSPLISEEDSLDAEIRAMLKAGLISQKDIMTAMMHEGLLMCSCLNVSVRCC
jgi:hypothetical protein